MTDEKKPADGETPVKKKTAAPDPRGEIRVKLPGYDPTLSTNSPDFDLEKWTAAAEGTPERLEVSLNQISEAIAAAARQIPANITAARLQDLRGAAAGAQEYMEKLTETIKPSFGLMQKYFNSDAWKATRDTLTYITEAARPLLELAREFTELSPYIDAELEKPEYGGQTIDDIYSDGVDEDTGEVIPGSLFERLLSAARAARDEQQRIIDAQNAGREQRRQMKEKAEASGAIMDIRNGTLPVLSDKDMWDAFAPGKISRIGTLASDYINPNTGRVEKINFEKGEIVSLNAAEISYKTFMLLSAITANSVENFREYFVLDGTISFYVKGVLDRLEVDPRIKDDGQLNIDRKTAGVLYLEKQFAPLLMFVGTIPDGSRYTVLNYDGYDANTDTMKIRTPYLHQIWKATQTAFSERKRNRKQRIAAGKKPLKKDLIPLEVNTLFKGTAYKEDDTVLEIATTITNILLNAGKGAHKTDILFTTLIKSCPRLREKLEEISARPKVIDGKKTNNTARYNVELRKIERAYKLIMNPEKCDALKCFAFEEFFVKIDGGVQKFVAPTKSTLDGKIHIKWRRIDTDDN